MMAKRKSNAASQLTGWRFIGKPGYFVPGLPRRFISLSEARDRNLEQALQAQPDFYEPVYSVEADPGPNMED